MPSLFIVAKRKGRLMNHIKQNIKKTCSTRKRRRHHTSKSKGLRAEVCMHNHAPYMTRTVTSIF